MKMCSRRFYGANGSGICHKADGHDGLHGDSIGDATPVAAAPWSPVTYYPKLDELTDTFARFVGQGGDHFEVVLPRKQWEAAGRPGQVYFEPKPWPIEASMEAGTE